MHEYSLVQSLLDAVDRAIAPHPGARVRAVHVRVGALAGVERELFALAYETFRAGTACADAPLVVADEPARWICPLCQQPMPEGEVLRCGTCDLPARLTGGDALELERLDLEID